MRNYEGLTAYLLERSEPIVELSFTQIEALVDGGLPASARFHPAWWANSRHSHPHARFWLDAGRQAQPDINSVRVRFPFGSERRLGPRSSPQRVAYRPISGADDPAATPEGEILSPDLEVDWMRLGEVFLESDRPSMPRTPARPGVYRFTLALAETDVVVYVGESDNLQRRTSGYHNPGSTQPTNRRINARIVETIRAGGSVELAISTLALLDRDALDLASRPARLLVENALLVHLGLKGAKVENL